MNRKAKILLHNVFAGTLAETDSGYEFGYEQSYLVSAESKAISKTLPLKAARFESKVLFPFFDGLIPEGWLLDIAIDNWKINGRDRFGLLLACCKNTIGAVSILVEENEKL